MDLISLASQAKSLRKEHKRFLTKLKAKKSQEIDRMFQEQHEIAFQSIDCLECANCCKTTGPLITDKDVVRIAKHLKLSPQQFIEQFLRIDEDEDYVLQSVPCPFLDHDNFCSIYSVRPKACREYPHTDRVKQKQLFSLALKNAEICPAVFQILEEIRKGFK